MPDFERLRSEQAFHDRQANLRAATFASHFDSYRFVDAGVKRCQCLDRLRRYDEALMYAREWQTLRPSDPALNAIIDTKQAGYAPGQMDPAWSLTGQTTAHWAITVSP